MLTFNHLLALEGIDISKVRLLRHQDSRLGAGRLYEAWRNERDAFEAYQRVQRRDLFSAGDLLASFVVTDTGKTVSSVCTGSTASAHAHTEAGTRF